MTYLAGSANPHIARRRLIAERETDVSNPLHTANPLGGANGSHCSLRWWPCLLSNLVLLVGAG